MNAPEKPRAANLEEPLETPGKEQTKASRDHLKPEDLKWEAEAALAALADQAKPLGRLNAAPMESKRSGPTTSKEPLQIDTAAIEKRGFIVPNGARTRSIQEFRGVKRSLLLNAISYDPGEVTRERLIMITSALPGEGKTFCAVNLALSLVEEKDYSVLLVDGDVAKPSVPEVLGLPETPGLIDALADPEIDIRSLIHSTSIPKLTFLSAGRAHPQATELLSSSLMDETLDSLLSIDSQQIIVFDSPPLLVSTEAPSLPPRMGQIVLVVETGGTKRSAVMDALTMIDRDDDSVSILLNKAPGGRSASGYGGYGYGYGYGRKG